MWILTEKMTVKEFDELIKCPGCGGKLVLKEGEARYNSWFEMDFRTFYKMCENCKFVTPLQTE